MRHIIGIILTFTILFFVLPIFAYLYFLMLLFKKLREVERDAQE